MEEQFWKDAWTERNIGFHMSEYNKALVEFIKKSSFKKNTKVLVPLCGKTLDMVFLKEQNFEIVGVEIAKDAVEEFFRENHFEYVVTEEENFKIYKTKSITIYCGDFFKLTSNQIGNIDFIFDRAATVALPPEMRVDYFNKIKELSNSKTELLLMTMHSTNEDKIGPPFSVKKEEVENAYQEDSIIFEVLNEQKMKINSKRLREQGVFERVSVTHHIEFK
jgi:thiopurine S-methyltransferase